VKNAGKLAFIPEFIHNCRMPSKDLKATVLETDAAYTEFYELSRLTVEHDLVADGIRCPLVREILHRSNVAAALLYDPTADKVVLVEQYRAGARVAGVTPWLINIVAGRIEAGLRPLDTIAREITEESGLTPT